MLPGGKRATTKNMRTKEQLIDPPVQARSCAGFIAWIPRGSYKNFPGVPTPAFYVFPQRKGLSCTSHIPNYYHTQYMDLWTPGQKIPYVLKTAEIHWGSRAPPPPTRSSEASYFLPDISGLWRRRTFSGTPHYECWESLITSGQTTE